MKHTHSLLSLAFPSLPLSFPSLSLSSPSPPPQMMARHKMQQISRYFNGSDDVWMQGRLRSILRMWSRYRKYKQAKREGDPLPSFKDDMRPLPEWGSFLQAERRKAALNRIAAKRFVRSVLRRMWIQWMRYRRYIMRRNAVFMLALQGNIQRSVRHALHQWRIYPVLVKIRTKLARRVLTNWRHYARKIAWDKATGENLKSWVNMRLVKTCWDIVSGRGGEWEGEGRGGGDCCCFHDHSFGLLH